MQTELEVNEPDRLCIPLSCLLPTLHSSHDAYPSLVCSRSRHGAGRGIHARRLFGGLLTVRVCALFASALRAGRFSIRFDAGPLAGILGEDSIAIARKVRH